MTARWSWWALVGVACSNAVAPPSSTPPSSTDSAPTGSDGDGSGDTAHTTSDSGGDDGGPMGPEWWSWEGEDTLTVDVFADGSPDCVFRWRTSGIQVAEACAGCDFDFEVTSAPDTDASTCAGAVNGLDRRWQLDGAFYIDGEPFDEAVLDGSVFEARRYTLTVDETYGAPVASTWEVTGTLR